MAGELIKQVKSGHLNLSAKEGEDNGNKEEENGKNENIETNEDNQSKTDSKDCEKSVTNLVDKFENWS